jgi:tetratricopeptide (TPR) repeat protein
MSKQTAHNLFMVSPFEIRHAGFYQDLLRGISSYEQLGNRLIQQAEQAHTFRQFDRVKEIGQILFNFPLKQYSSIGTYFIGVALNSCGNGDQDKAKGMFELVVDTAPDKYKAKAILSLAAVSFHIQAYDAALRFYNETIKAAPLDSSTIHASRTIAIIKAMEGQHQAAVRDLENLYPLAKYAAPHVYFDYLNSLAVELGEVGRKDEARNIMRVVLASPFASAYPEWRETAEELKPSRRSMVTVGAINYNLLAMPQREPSEQPTVQSKPARVLSIAKWKKKTAKKAADRKIEKSLQEMSFKEMGFKLLELITSNRADEDQMRLIVAYVMQVFSAPLKPPDKPSA